MGGDEETDADGTKRRGKKDDKVVATVLGYLVIVGSTMYKLPQIMRIHKAGSARGVSLAMLSMDSVHYVFTLAYSIFHGHPLSIYGENFAQYASAFTLILQVFRYERRASPAKVARVAAALIAFAATAIRGPALMGKEIGGPLLDVMKSSTMALQFGSLPQVIQNWRTRSAGELSLVSFSLGSLGGLVRLYTTLAKVGHDRKMALTPLMSAAINLTIVSQILFYRRGGR
eukprot:gnl/TRDRNA2_/TRDRNA2_84905_c0_seq2.p1 gnl/TRDRNA2_/TRDRNA2_84905_c0~~gnl/TRDRNA2_/TRDRNA2_84905_c0_seq2.p1  ORF type:complete len:229 (+),score=38.10 gnl/TRDRNA2_/TRDRNA2_84905_c0_seq2:47-733(+)